MPAQVPQVLLDNIGGLGVLAVVLWWMWRTRNNDAASQLADAFTRIGRLQQRIEKLEDHDRKQAVVLQTHAAWDAKALGGLPPETAGLIGPPPPLYPPEEA